MKKEICQNEIEGGNRKTKISKNMIKKIMWHSRHV